MNSRETVWEFRTLASASAEANEAYLRKAQELCREFGFPNYRCATCVGVHCSLKDFDAINDLALEELAKERMRRLNLI